MSTVALVNTHGPTLHALTGLLASLRCRTVALSRMPDATHALVLALVVAEFRPQDGSLAAFAAGLDRQARWPVVVIGPDLPERQVGQLRAAGAAAYLRAGALPPEKRAILAAQLPPVPRAQLRVGPLQLDEARREVRCGADPVALTAAEFRLLRLLMQQPGQTLGCAVLEQLAGCRDAASHLRRVRRKLASCTSAPLLRGSPGQGYALDARRHPRSFPDPAFALRHHLRRLG